MAKQASNGTVGEFKSERAARAAYTKAEKAYEKIRGERIAFEHENRPMPCVDDSDVGEWADKARALHATLVRMNAAEHEAFQKARAVYEQADKQGIFIDSWHFGHNPTRDLIAANMD